MNFQCFNKRFWQEILEVRLSKGHLNDEQGNFNIKKIFSRPYHHQFIEQLDQIIHLLHIFRAPRPSNFVCIFYLPEDAEHA